MKVNAPTMKQRLSQAKIYRALRALQGLIAAVHDARVRYAACAKLRPRRLAGLARLMKKMASLPHTADYGPYEAELKRKLIRAQYRLLGVAREGSPGYALAADLPVCYGPAVDAFVLQSRYLLRVLADVEARCSRH